MGDGPSKLTAVDLFCGAGGLSEGFRQAGFNVLVGQDYDAAAGKTFEATHPEGHLFPYCVTRVPLNRLVSRGGRRTPCRDLKVTAVVPPQLEVSTTASERFLTDILAGAIINFAIGPFDDPESHDEPAACRQSARGKVGRREAETLPLTRFE